jgi:hypothetical protein
MSTNQVSVVKDSYLCWSTILQCKGRILFLFTRPHDRNVILHHDPFYDGNFLLTSNSDMLETIQKMDLTFLSLPFNRTRILPSAPPWPEWKWTLSRGLVTQPESEELTFPIAEYSCMTLD